MKKILIICFIVFIMSSFVQAKSFQDIEGLSCEKAVESLEHIGIINGVNVGEYAPQKSVTRAELSKMMVSAIGASTTGTKTFSDIQGHWGEKYIQQAATMGILNGYTDGTFKPDQKVSYAETIAILIRSLNYQLAESHSEKWYENYLTKMKEIGIDEGIDSIEPEEYATRGNIAILLWNTILSKANGTSLLEKNFSEYQYFSNKKITSINYRNGRIVYHTDDFDFYVDNDIHFSDIGGMASGFLDVKTSTVLGLEIDAGRNLKKISGNTKEINAKGYDIFNCAEIWGYGAKEKANYVEIFVNAKTDITERVVYYDTTESHFATKIKIGVDKIKIESKNVYDTSIIIHNGNTITLKILRNETVKDISANAILVYEGKIVPWTSIPDNSVIREIKKDYIYTYVHTYVDTKLDEKHINQKGVTIDEKYHIFSEECIAENVVTDTAAKLNEGLTTEDLIAIAKKDDKVRLYFNEFDEIVKMEFSYDIWKVNQEEETKNEKEELANELKKLGFITNLGYIASGTSSKEDEEDDKIEYKISPLPRKDSYTFVETEGKFKVGDFVYLQETEKTEDDKKKIEKSLVAVTTGLEAGDLKIISNINGVAIDDNSRLAGYQIMDSTELIEVLLTIDSQKEGKYEKCSMSFVNKDYLKKNTKSMKLHIIANKDNVALRVYVVKEIGTNYQFGIVKNIEVTKSGDTITSQKIYIVGENKGTKRYTPTSLNRIEIGDLITFTVEKSTDKKLDDVLTCEEIYDHRILGNQRDLIVKEYKKGIVLFSNSTDLVDFNQGTFKIGNREYDSNEYIIINAEVYKDASGDWVFRYYSVPKNVSSIKAKAGSRFVVDELTRTIVIYNGFED